MPITAPDHRDDGSAPARPPEATTTPVDTPPHFGRLYLYIVGLLAAITPGVVWLAMVPSVVANPIADRHQLAFGAVLVVLVVLADLITVDIEFRHTSINLSFMWVPVLLGLFLLDPLVVLVLKVGATLAVLTFVRHQPRFKLLVNFCVAVIEVVVVAAVLKAASATSTPDIWIAMAVGASLADVAAALAVAGAISIFQGHWEPGTWKSVEQGLPITLLSVGYAAVLIVLLQNDHAEVVFALGIGMLSVFLLRMYSTVAARYRRLRLLDDFTRALSAAANEGKVVPVLLREAAEVLHADRAMLIVRDRDLTTRIETRNGAPQPASATHLDATVLTHLGPDATLFDGPGAVTDALQAEAITEAMAARLSTTDHDELVLVVAERSGTLRPFDDDDVALFDTLAAHADLALQNMALVDRLQAEVSSTEHQATHDALTDLPNRVLFHQTIEDVLADGDDVAVVLLDLDRFKEINDTLGHHNGDLLLIEVGNRIRQALEPQHLVARLGGDEFAVALAGCTNEADARTEANKVVAALAPPVELTEMSVDIGGSVGIALSTGVDVDVDVHTPDASALLRHADVAMYWAKVDNTSVEVYSADRDHYSPQRLALVGKLRHAIEHGELTLAYQPQLDLATGTVIGAEALVRWPQAGGRSIPPDEFIGLAEHTGLIRPLSQFVLQAAIAQAADWRRRGLALRVAANLSAPNLSEPTLVDEIAALLAEHDLPADLLTVEITESVVMANPLRCIASLQDLRDLGIRVSIDDFGTGHSSLSYLTSLPATELKVDKSFVWAMISDPAAATLVGAIVDLGRNLGFEIIAEGVETENTANQLLTMGCENAQGYYFARPMFADQFERWLAQRENGTATRPPRTPVDLRDDEPLRDVEPPAASGDHSAT